jgi:hypothetical protein
MCRSIRSADSVGVLLRATAPKPEMTTPIDAWSSACYPIR